MPIRALLAALARRGAARRAEAHLATLPDHLLRDVGLTRDRIPDAVRGLAPDDPPATRTARMSPSGGRLDRRAI